eukprot:Hpha_TRINITY_DN3815_c0_g1::TRINITY_DN3815_c0_g1_i1::g.44625::m.44625
MAATVARLSLEENARHGRLMDEIGQLQRFNREQLARALGSSSVGDRTRSTSMCTSLDSFATSSADLSVLNERCAIADQLRIDQRAVAERLKGLHLEQERIGDGIGHLWHRNRAEPPPEEPAVWQMERSRVPEWLQREVGHRTPPRPPRSPPLPTKAPEPPPRIGDVPLLVTHPTEAVFRDDARSVPSRRESRSAAPTVAPPRPSPPRSPPSPPAGEIAELSLTFLGDPACVDYRGVVLSALRDAGFSDEAASDLGAPEVVRAFRVNLRVPAGTAGQLEKAAASGRYSALLSARAAEPASRHPTPTDPPPLATQSPYRQDLTAAAAFAELSNAVTSLMKGGALARGPSRRRARSRRHGRGSPGRNVGVQERVSERSPPQSPPRTPRVRHSDTSVSTEDVGAAVQAARNALDQARARREELEAKRVMAAASVAQQRAALARSDEWWHTQRRRTSGSSDMETSSIDGEVAASRAQCAEVTARMEGLLARIDEGIAEAVGCEARWAQALQDALRTAATAAAAEAPIPASTVPSKGLSRRASVTASNIDR